MEAVVDHCGRRGGGYHRHRDILCNKEEKGRRVKRAAGYPAGRKRREYLWRF